MKTRSIGILAVLTAILLWWVAPAAAQVEPPYDPEILPKEYAGPPLPVKEPESIANSGAARLSYPIAVPPGRRGLAPRLSLEYNSGGRNGIAGVGWDLTIGAIRRATRNGLDYAGAAFEHDGAELAPRPDWGSGFFGAKREERFSRYQLLSASSGWVMTTRDGVRHFFGTRPESRQENPFGVFQWCLDRVEDANGNYYSLTYAKDQGQIYPAEIRYTGNGRLGPTHAVRFTLEARPDVFESFLTKTRVVTAKRLAAVTTHANGQAARTFTVVYETGRTGRSRIRQIHSAPLPPVTFAYQEGGDGTFVRRAAAATEGGNGAGLVFQGPCDADGYPDLIKFNNDSLTPWVHTYLADGAGGYGGRISTRLAGGANNAGFLLVADFDADGSVDIVKAEASGTLGTVYFHRGLGNGAFAPGVRSDLGGMNDPGRLLVGDVVGQDGRLELIRHKSLYGLVTIHRLLPGGGFDAGAATNLGAIVDKGRSLMMDCNGDRRDDLVRTNLTSRVFVHFARGDGTFAGPVETDLGNGPNDPGMLSVGDFNGDGLPDLLKVRSLSSRIYVHFSQGTGAFAPGVETDLKGPAIDVGRIFAADVDRDGTQDILRHYFNATVVDCYRSAGDGTFLPAAATALGAGPLWKGYLAAANVDGAGGADLVLHDRFGKFTTFTSSSNVPDLLIRTRNGLGATHSFSYRPSAGYENHYLPFPVETLAAVTVEDGNGVAATRACDYSGGLFDPAEAEFRGFERLEETLPDGTLRETAFHQDAYLVGREQQVERRSPANRTLTKTALAWAAEPLQGAARFVQLKSRQIEHYFDPAVFSKTDYLYSATHGGILSSVQSGSGAGPVTTSFSHRNLGAWIWRSDRETLAGDNGGVVRDTYFSHDARGNRTAEEKWDDGGTNPVTRWTYDAYGNPASRTDARGHATFYEYDAATSAFPARITLPRTGAVSHVWQVPEFDYRTGRARVLEDENGNRTLYAYDALGRLVQADFPDGGRTTHAYVETTFPVHVRTSVHDGSAIPITSFTYFDGLGRRIQTTTAGEKGRPVYTRWFFDELGRNFLHEGPYFAGVGDYPWTRTEYDPWNRPVSVSRADGEHGTVATRYSYSGLSATETDPDGAARTITRDHLERVARLVEHADQGDVATTFDYNAAGDLLRITNHAGMATRFERDTLGRPRAIRDPDMGAWQHTFDANGNLKTQTDAMGRTVALEYDPLNRIVLRSPAAPAPPVTYTYDNLATPNGVGRLHTVSGAQATISYDAYDEMGRVLADTRSFAGNPTRFTTRTEYDPAGNPTAVVYPLDGYRVEYAYHPGTRLVQRVGGPGGVEFAELEEYTADGRPGLLYQGNGTSTGFVHDRRSGRLKTIRIQAPSLDPTEDIFHQAYSHTPGGDIREIADRVRSTTRRYAYDKLHRLISETSPGAVLVHPSKVVRMKYGYEGTGPFHAPKKIELRGLTHGLQYDANGNLVDGPALADPQKVTRRAIDYTVDNMPSRIDQSGAACPEGLAGGICPDRIEILYDGENRRAVKRSAAGTTYYVGRHFEVRNGSPVRHVFAGDLRLAQVTPEGVRHFHKDHLLSTVAVTDEAGAVVESSAYIPFGQPRNRTGTTASAFRYTDQELDNETGLYNYKARLYDPLTAVFNTPDPFLSANLVFASVAGAGGNHKSGQAPAGEKAAAGQNVFDTRQLISFFGKTSQHLNRFAYVQNNPVNYVDSAGLWPTRIHNKIVREAFGSLDFRLKSQIFRGSAETDSLKYQGSKSNHMHALRQKGESIEAAEEKMQQYVNDHLKAYQRLLNEGQTEDAFFQLGMALHPIMDSTSPSHQGFQEWEIFPEPTSYDFYKHIFQEQRISDDQLSKSVELIRQAMDL